MAVEIGRIRELLADHSPRVIDIPFEEVRVRGSVALCLREAGRDTELLFIQRAEFEGDVWSGDVAFPGGRVDSADEPPKDAAERETLEEVGIDLAKAEYLGRIDDITGSTDAVLVSAFVYRVERDVAVVFNHEVASYRWMPLAETADPARQMKHTFNYGGDPVEVPALRAFDDERVPLLWGLTYRFLQIFTELLDHPIPDMGWNDDL